MKAGYKHQDSKTILFCLYFFNITFVIIVLLFSTEIKRACWQAKSVYKMWVPHEKADFIKFIW